MAKTRRERRRKNRNLCMVSLNMLDRKKKTPRYSYHGGKKGEQEKWCMRRVYVFAPNER
jgi:hypothetical protein